MSPPPRPRPLRLHDVRSTVATRCPAGHPQVLRCHPLRGGLSRCEPFPTLYWLVCPSLTYALSKLEHAGWITRLAERLQTEEAFRAAVEHDHDAYAAERWALLDAGEIAAIQRRGLEAEFRERGIGGIRDRSSVKCLHLHYAHHLARGSAIGQALDEMVGDPTDLLPCRAAGAAG